MLVVLNGETKIVVLANQIVNTELKKFVAFPTNF